MQIELITRFVKSLNLCKQLCTTTTKRVLFNVSLLKCVRYVLYLRFAQYAIYQADDTPFSTFYRKLNIGKNEIH